MLSHESVWSAIDLLARKHGLTPSGLARRAGLDPTTFNPSKRTSADGRPRWPSMESIAKILGATRADLADFVALVGAPRVEPRGDALAMPPPDPRLALAQAGAQGFFNDGFHPAPIEPAAAIGETEERDFAIKVRGDAMMPLYRDGDVVVVSPRARIRKGDRVIVRTVTGTLSAAVFERRNRAVVELRPVAPADDGTTLPAIEISWIARIIWASQ